MRRLATAAVVIAAAAVPAVAQGASYLNDSATDGAYVVTRSRTIETLQIYCAGQGWEDRELRFDVPSLVRVRRSGRFSYSGIAYRYGPEAQPRGEPEVRLKGRLSGSSGLRIDWTLPGCGSGTSTASIQR